MLTAVRHGISLHGNWTVVCLPRYHSIEGNGVRLFTPRRNQSRPVRRCAVDPVAQRFLGWKQEWIDYLLAPDSIARRLDVRPEPWIGDTLTFGVTRPRSRDIIGYGWIDFESDAPEIGFALRPDQRRSGLGYPTGFAMIALLHRHWGFPVAGGATADDNAPVAGTASKSSLRIVETGREYVLPNGDTCRSNIYRAGDLHAECRCRWGLGRDDIDTDRFMSLDPTTYVDVTDGPAGKA